MDKNLQVACPNVEDLTMDEMLEQIKDSPYTIPKENRVEIIKYMYKIFGYTLEPDLLFFLADETKKKLVLAPAGGGKTTTMSANFILEKAYRRSKLRKGFLKGDNILCLVYNNHNVKDVLDRHIALVNMVKRSGIKGLEHIDDRLKVCTVHSFCGEWVSEYEAKCGVVGFKLIVDDAPKVSLMSSAVKRQIKKFGYNFTVEDVNVNNLLSLYNFMRESMMDYSEIEHVDKFIDLGLDIEFIEKVFTQYDNIKRKKRQMDYTDLLTLFYDLIKNNPDVVERIQKNYEYFTADEVQDLTPLIMNILKILSKGCPLVCIGDDDQCIYPFRGADPNNILRFTDMFPKGKVFLLKTNRRCPSNVISLAKSVIGRNINRYDKDIRTVKPKGNIEFKCYRDRLGQFSSIVQMLKEMSDDDKNNTCICYRNRSSSTSLVNMLLDNGIHFHVLSGNKPFEYGLYRAVFDVLKALQIGTNKQLLFNLYKCLPIKKDELAEALKYDPIKREGTDGKDHILLSQIDFGKKLNNQAFKTAWTYCLMIAKTMNTVPLKDYFPGLFSMIKRYYWDGIVSYQQLDVDEDNEFTVSVNKYFMVNKTFREKLGEYETQLSVIKRDQASYNGVCVSTFHSLKGLEFKNVIIVDMQESIFPNTTYIDMKPYSDEAKLALKETETRLFYVAITRAKENLTIYYSQSDPSMYISILLNAENNTKQATDVNKEPVKKLEALDNFSFIEDDEDEEDDDSLGISLIEENGETLSLDDVKAYAKKTTSNKRIAKENQYFYNPKSDCYWMLHAGEEIVESADMMSSVEVSIEEYNKAVNNSKVKQEPVPPVTDFKQSLRNRFFR